MEENEKYAALREILTRIENALELYNRLNPQGNLAITPQDERKDVSDIFICVYNEKHVGLFKKINWSTEKRNKNSFSDYDAVYDAGSIYVGINSNYIGMKVTHSYNTYKNEWQPVGKQLIVSGKSYTSN